MSARLNFSEPDVRSVWRSCPSLFSRQKQGNKETSGRCEPPAQQEMQVVLEEGCGASCGTGFRGKSGEYIFKTSFMTIGFDPFDDVFFSSKLTSSTVCTVFPRGNSLVVWNDGDVFDVIKVNGVILKNSEEICTPEHSSVVIETGSLSQHPLKVTVHPFTPSDVADKMHDTKLTAILDDGTGPNHCNGPAFLTCVNPSHNCKERRQLLPASLVRCFISDSEWYLQDQMFTTFLKKYGDDCDKWPGPEGTCSFEWRDFLKKYGEDSGMWPDSA